MMSHKREDELGGNQAEEVVNRNEKFHKTAKVRLLGLSGNITDLGSCLANLRLALRVRRNYPRIWTKVIKVVTMME